MKDHKEVMRQLSYGDIDGPLDVVIQKLKVASEGLIDPRLELIYGYDYVDFNIKGWVPLTPDEIKKAREKSQRIKEASKKASIKTKLKRTETFLKEAKKLGYNVVKT